MTWIVCWLKGHIWFDPGVAMSHPYERYRKCRRCGTREEIVTTIGR